MKCCQCKKAVEIGPEALDSDNRDRSDLAIRCVYCLSLFCVTCSERHFESRNAGKVQKRIVKTTVIEEWIETPNT